jgi:hypothetical protein
MARTNIATAVVDELSRRLKIMGLPKGKCDFERHEREKYCTVSRCEFGPGAKAYIDFYIGPYFGSSAKMWIGFCSPRAEAIEPVKVVFDPDAFTTIAYNEWNNYRLSPSKTRELRDRSYLSYEDYRSDKGWVWFGQYMELDTRSAALASDFIAQVMYAAGVPLASGDSKPIGPTEKKAFQKQRLVQGHFRTGVRKAWNGRCAVTGSNVQAALRASHIAPWNSHPKHRSDPHNGLFLIATLDALFDRGLISFRDDGKLLVAPLVDSKQRTELGLRPDMSLRAVPSQAQRVFLKIHRDFFGF